MGSVPLLTLASHCPGRIAALLGGLVSAFGFPLERNPVRGVVAGTIPPQLREGSACKSH
jgi:hypothetical protein